MFSVSATTRRKVSRRAHGWRGGRARRWRLRRSFGDDDLLPECAFFRRGDGTPLEARVLQHGPPRVGAERRRAGDADLGVREAPPAFEQAERNVREQRGAAGLVQQQHAAGRGVARTWSQVLRMSAVACSTLAAITEIVAARGDVLRGGRLLDVKDCGGQ